MIKPLSILLIAVISTMAFSCSSQGSEESVVPFEVIHSGANVGFEDKRQVLLTNNDDYQKLMAEVYKNFDQLPRIPEVDFTKNDVVAVFMGTRSSGGYGISVDKIIKRSDAVTVYINETTPGKNCMSTDALTQPYQLVKVPKLDQKVKYITKEKVKDCN